MRRENGLIFKNPSHSPFRFGHRQISSKTWIAVQTRIFTLWPKGLEMTFLFMLLWRDNTCQDERRSGGVIDAGKWKEEVSSAQRSGQIRHTCTCISMTAGAGGSSYFRSGWYLTTMCWHVARWVSPSRSHRPKTLLWLRKPSSNPVTSTKTWSNKRLFKSLCACGVSWRRQRLVTSMCCGLQRKDLSL